MAFLSEASSRSIYEPRHDKTNKMTVRPAKTQIRGDAQADLSLRCAHTHFVGFCHVAAHIGRANSEGAGETARTFMFPDSSISH